MIFPIEKILTVSAGDYIANMSGAVGRHYEMKGVHVELRPEYHESSLINAFAENVPENA